MKSKFLLIVFANLLTVSTMAEERQPSISVVMSLCLKHLQALAPEFHDNTLFIDSQRGLIIRTEVNGGKVGVYTTQKATFVGDTGACEISAKESIETEMARIITRVGYERSKKEIVGKVFDMLNFCYPVATNDVLKNAMIQTADRMGLDREKIVNPGKANH